jgi:ABC-type transporter Mla subunit MlaD
VDLDQVLDVLDGDTRARLAILINETGLALTGRRSDYNALLERLPRSLDAATRMVGEVATDNRALGRLIERGDRLVTRIAAERRSLGRLVDVSATTMRNVASKRRRLGESLTRAPGTLAALRGFLTELRAATGPLGPAAKSLEAAGPPLARTLAALAPFERSARPTLEQASAVAPRLTRLADDALPVVRRARPAARSLADLAETMPPLSRTLRTGVDDLLGGVEGIARSTQEQDRAGHYWRAAGIISTESLQGIVGQLLDQSAGRRAPRSRGAKPRPSENRSAAESPARPDRPARPQPPADRLKSAVPKLLDALPDGTLPKRLLESPPSLLGPGRDRDAEPLLDFLLG